MSIERHAGRPADPADLDEGERDALAGLERQIETMRLRHRGDPPLEVLHAARHDVLPGEWQARVDVHLAASPWSRALVGGVAADTARIAEDEDRLDAVTEARLLARITRDVRGVPSTSPRRWLHARPLWIGAAAAAAILIALTLRTSRETPAPTPEVVQTDASARQAGTRLDPTTATPPPFALAFDKPEVRLSAAALVWRGPSTGAPAAAGTYLADLKPALDAYRASDYARANAAFATLRPRYPGAIEVLFYQGASRLLRDDPAGALEPLTEATRAADQAFAADVALLLAAAEQRTGRTEAARARLRRACTPGDARSARVCSALSQLDSAVPAAPAGR
jgi:hypothetical protein